MMQRPIQFLLLIVLLTVLGTVVRGYGSMVGGRIRINNVESNEEVQNLGRYCVEQFNKDAKQAGRAYLRHKDAGGSLEFVAVVEAEKQVVAGLKYYLNIDAEQGGKRKTFDAVVLVQPWLHGSKKLLSFGPSTGN